MKKWMKAMSVVFTLVMVFCLVGGIGAKADTDYGIQSILRVTYEGEDVPYGEAINPGDFEVQVRYTDGSRGYLSPSEFTISPDKMDSERSERVTVYVEAADGRKLRSSSILVNCAEPKLVSIDARYIGDDLIVGGEINKSDVRVEATYDNGKYREVDDWTFGSYRLREGSNSVTIYYREDDERVSDTITVYAYEGELSYISAYYSGGIVPVGGKVDTSKIKVTGVYSERGYSNVTQTLTGWSLADYTIQEGNNTLTVVYKEDGKQFTDTITVRGGNTTSTSNNNNTNTNTIASTSTVSGKWVQSGAAWKFQLNNKTYVKNSWIQDAMTAKWYFVDADGTMVANRWLMVNGKWYFPSADGTISTGWKQVDGKWYYLNAPDGDMFTGWKYHNEKWYYLTPGSGEMATSRWIDNWYVDADGVWTQTR